MSAEAIVEVIKPCPFCGGKQVEVWSFLKQGKKTVAWMAACAAEHDRGGQCVANGPAMPTAAEAIAAWNARATDPALNACVEALEEGERVITNAVEAIDAYNKENGTHLCGGALFGLAKALNPIRAALALSRGETI